MLCMSGMHVVLGSRASTVEGIVVLHPMASRILPLIITTKKLILPCYVSQKLPRASPKPFISTLMEETPSPRQLERLS